MKETQHTSSWSIIEYMAGDEPTLIFDGAKPRQYVSIRRREQYRSIQISDAITAAVKAAVGTSDRVQTQIHVKENYPPLTLIAHPVFGPENVAYGVQLWVGPTDENPPALRAIGAFEWDPKSKITFHGPTIETDILGIDDPKTQRVSPEVFRHFEAFPREAELGRFCEDIRLGIVEPGETFDSSLTVRGVDDVVRQAYMTMRAVQKPTGVWALRGIVHDISDVQKPQLTDTYDRRTARVTATLINESQNIGIGHMDFATGIVTEWLAPPPPPLDEWVTRNAEFHPDDVTEMTVAQMELATEKATKAEYTSRVRFDPDGKWHTAKFVLAAATSGPHGHGLIRIEHVDNAPESTEPEPTEEDTDTDEFGGGPLLW